MESELPGVNELNSPTIYVGNSSTIFIFLLGTFIQYVGFIKHDGAPRKQSTENV
jgi:hypothetical protein